MAEQTTENAVQEPEAPAAATATEAVAAAAPAGDLLEDPIDTGEVENNIVEALKTVFDPEIPVNIYELGLIYDIHIQPDGRTDIKMTLTSPACPVAGSLPGEVKAKVENVSGVSSADIELVWDPVWNPSMMSEAARLELGMF